MKSRKTLKQAFLLECGLGDCEIFPVGADASFRSYDRVISGGKSFILMDAPPDKEPIEPFMKVAGYLLDNGLSAPEIYNCDKASGFMLLEDFGDSSYSKILKVPRPKFSEIEIYSEAIDVLVKMSEFALPDDMPNYSNEMLKRECMLLTDWYLPNVCSVSEDAVAEYAAIWQGLLSQEQAFKDVVVLRDYHADNLMWLVGRDPLKRVGLLDFQDAVIGNPAYDIVSLLEDARRDVPQDVVNILIERYLAARREKIDKSLFLLNYDVLAAQRNCKIVGIFARLAVRDGKKEYLEYLPRVWRNLERDLSSSALLDLRKWFDRCAPTYCRDVSVFKTSKVEAV